MIFLKIENTIQEMIEGGWEEGYINSTQDKYRCSGGGGDGLF